MTKETWILAGVVFVVVIAANIVDRKFISPNM